ncbi:MAG TPA: serine/threonine-protein kinase [Planctomycetota bacterium]|nr:serine/threonine-protein kinase [Planctomycetota bacterium]
MQCARCSLHFSASGPDARCPSCGGESDEARPASSPASAVPTGPSLREDAERTRTEALGEADWAPGSIVAGKYEILSRLGSGGFGTVYKVRHVFRKKHYALKTPHAEYARDNVFRQRFEREIEAMERFVHPDAVMIRDSGLTSEGRPYYTMDFIEGESLKVVLRREKTLSVDRAIHIATRVLKVLEVAHSHRIIHRDIKPDNILLARGGGREAVKVLDFGVAKLLDLVEESRSITRGERVGTPRYMSPEQITGEPIDERSDFFSLGIVIYEMLTGRHPFSTTRDPIRITAAILGREPKPPREVCPDIPRALSDQLLAMIEKKPRKRPSTAGVVIRQLATVRGSASRTEPIEALALWSGAPRGPAVSLVLKAETSAGERRAFLIFEEKAGMGRSSDPERGIANHIILRCLPCRSRALDPENWQKNLTISHSICTVHPEGSSLVIEPAPGLKNGLGIGGVRSSRTARIQADRFHLSIGDRALELDGYLFPRSADGPNLDLSFLEEGRPFEVEPPRLTGYSNDACGLDCVSFHRVRNAPLHEYHVVYRILRIGSSAQAHLKLRGAGVEAVHAAVILEAGEAFLLALAPRVRVACGARLAVEADGGCGKDGAGATDSGCDAPVIVDLLPRRLLPLTPGVEIMLGDERLLVEAAAERHFKSV